MRMRWSSPYGADLACAYNSFYSKLYAIPEMDRQQKDCGVELLCHIPINISRDA